MNITITSSELFRSIDFILFDFSQRLEVEVEVDE